MSDEQQAGDHDELIRLLRCVRVLDCGAHYCRYCPAKSPDWQHGAYCPYVESQHEWDAARAMIRRLEAARPSPASLDARIAALREERDRLRLERDSAREQFDKHVEWASGEVAAKDAEIKALREQLRRAELPLVQPTRLDIGL